mmetsp:Transcript_29343/g.47692  ORF Transcript_29343/g.47692 Transcript_29343/m.47692 type:complete len:85 (+) Transcript_29343:1128-1382(+)
MWRREGIKQSGAGENNEEKEGVNLGQQLSLFFVLFLFLYFSQWKEEEGRRGGGITLAVAVIVSCKLFDVVVETILLEGILFAKR